MSIARSGVGFFALSIGLSAAVLASPDDAAAQNSNAMPSGQAGFPDTRIQDFGRFRTGREWVLPEKYQRKDANRYLWGEPDPASEWNASKLRTWNVEIVGAPSTRKIDAAALSSGQVAILERRKEILYNLKKSELAPLSAIDAKVLPDKLVQSLAKVGDNPDLKITNPAAYRVLVNGSWKSFYEFAGESGLVDAAEINRYLGKAAKGVNYEEQLAMLQAKYPPDLLVQAAGTPGKGGGCPTCVVSPGTPIPHEPGVPVIDPPIPFAPTANPANESATSLTAWEKFLENRRADPFNPLGFYEIVRVRNALGATAAECTGTVLAPLAVLTAAHCVPYRLIPGQSTIAAAVMSVEIPRASKQAMLACTARLFQYGRYDQPCVDFQAFQVVAVRVHPGFDSGGGYESPINDLAILELPESARVLTEAHQAAPDFSLPMPSEITIAGYGRSSSPDHNPRLLEVGWNAGETLWQPHGRDFYYNPKLKSQSATCLGDSGGPVFRSKLGGDEPEAKLIVGVISAGVNQPDKCDSSYWVTVTRLSDGDVRRWLCEDKALKAIKTCL
jgi:hypothetical protein